MKTEYVVVNSSDKFDIGHCHIKVNVTLGFEKFLHYTVRSYKTTLVQARKHLLSCVYPLLIKYKIY